MRSWAKDKNLGCNQVVKADFGEFKFFARTMVAGGAV